MRPTMYNGVMTDAYIRWQLWRFFVLWPHKLDHSKWTHQS